MSDNKYYVYLHIRLDTGAVFYVGKGHGRRAKSKWNRNKWWNNITKKTSWIPVIVQDKMSEDSANLLEMWLIAKLRHGGVELCNICDGGEGFTGPNTKLRKPLNCSNGMRFDMIGDAARWAGVSRECISRAARGDTNQSGGYAWWFDGYSPKEYISTIESRASTNSKQIIRSDGVRYKSLIEAAKSVSGSPGNISIAARSGELVRYGYTWRYTQ